MPAKHCRRSTVIGALSKVHCQRSIVEGELLKDSCGRSTTAEKPAKSGLLASRVLYQLNVIAQSASYHFHCKISATYLHFLLHQMICLMMPCVQLTKTVCGGSSGWLLLQAPFSQLPVQEKGAQAWMASPTGDV